MKQTITKEQWDELSFRQKSAVIIALYPCVKHECIPSSEEIVELQLDEYFKDYGVNNL